MARQIIIALDGAVHPGPPDAALVHRLRNFGEDLYREFSASGKAEVSLDEIDSATSEAARLCRSRPCAGVASGATLRLIR